MSEHGQPDHRKYGGDTARDGRTGRFARGNAGRPRGARNRATAAAMALLEGEGERLARKAVELALAGDVAALKLCLERVLPKGRAVRLPLPLATVEDLDAATRAIGRAVEEGSVTLEEAKTAAELVEARRRVLEATELAARVARVEEVQRELRRGGGP